VNTYPFGGGKLRTPDRVCDIFPRCFSFLVQPSPLSGPAKTSFGGGKPRTPDRVCMDAVFFVLRTGCQWKALRNSFLPRVHGA
jgi:hypothetical protein